jgi:4-alpha-glucanotransferase
MKIRFSINYRTEWGQQLAVSIRYVMQDGGERTAHVPMTTQDGEHWTAETAVVESRRSPVMSLVYYYLVEDSEGHQLRREWTMVPRLYAFDDSKSYTFADQWCDMPLPYHLYTNAYAVTTGGRPDDSVEAVRLPLFRKTIVFRVSAPQLQQGQLLAIVGNHPALGSWSPVRYLPMTSLGQKEWMISLNVDGLVLPLEYKYVVVDEKTSQLVTWEEGDNRVVADSVADGEVLVTYGQPLRVAEKSWRAAGVSVPVFSLRSEHSCGVGDFGDLVRFIDWVALTGMKIIQLLPVNDTYVTGQWGDSCPYNITSAFALHPHYIDLEQLGALKDKNLMTAFRRQQRELNALPYSDYEAVGRVKDDYLRHFFELQGEKTLHSEDFQSWQKANSFWLDAYCSRSPYGPQLAAFIQYHLHIQLKAAVDKARSRGIFLMGDLPIGMGKTSVDAALHPELFHLDSQAGAPPDTFDRQGQNWQFPPYRWSEESKGKAKESTAGWFRRRLSHQQQYFDAIRIDHVLGFFRTWEIPIDQLFATMGRFSPALPFTADEIEHFGLPFRREFLTRPFINDRIIDRFFGIHAQYVREQFLVKKAYGLYDLKEEVATQQRIARHFEGQTDENSLWIRDALHRLVANVLFLEDLHQPETYHPRIAAWHEPVFEVLSTEERDAYMRLYNNFFYQRHSMFWGKTGYDRLSAILADSRLLICAEDLGMLPDCVPAVLDALRILTLEIQRLPKQTGVEFAHLDANPVRSIATISTHDMSSLRQWWQEDAQRARRFSFTMLQKQGRVPEQLPAHWAEEIIARHLYCPSMLCLLSLQDWLAMDGELRSKKPSEERINVPGDPYCRWQWRMHLTIEQLVEATRYNEKVKTMIVRSKR